MLLTPYIAQNLIHLDQIFRRSGSDLYDYRQLGKVHLVTEKEKKKQLRDDCYFFGTTNLHFFGGSDIINHMIITRIPPFEVHTVKVPD